MKVLYKFLSDDSGATAIEYALIAALIAMALIGGATTLGQSLKGLFNTAGVELTRETVS